MRLIGARGIRPSGAFVFNRESPQGYGLQSWLPLTRFTNLRDLAQEKVVATNQAPLVISRAWGSSNEVQNLTFALDQHFILGNPTTLQITGDLTLAIWFAVGAAPSAGVAAALITKANLASYAYNLDIFNDSTGVYGTVGTVTRGRINGGSGTDQNNGSNTIAGNTVLSVGGAVAVYHAAMVYSATGTLDLYLNGISDHAQRTGEATSINTTTANALVGRNADSSSFDQWNGQLWDARIYNRALSANEVWELYDPETRWDLYGVSHRLMTQQFSALKRFILIPGR